MKRIEDASNPCRLPERPEWRGLMEHHERVKDLHLRELFISDDQRASKMSLEAEDLFLDYSKNRVTEETLRRLLDLAETSGLRREIEAMFLGEKINATRAP